VFNVKEEVLGADFTNKKQSAWDSVTHLSLMTEIEDEFDIMLDSEDILEFTSFEKGKRILKKYNIDLNEDN
jgi:acyl carrier protein